jgi:dihydrofolate synthase/folylpolyglutamate synthase
LTFLGPTLRHVLREKLGICRPGVPHFISVPPALEAEARAYCRENLVPAFFLGREIRGAARGAQDRRQTVAVRLPDGTSLGVAAPLLGPHQAGNAALAAGLCRALARRGWRLDEKHLRRGFAAARWPGRFDVFRAGGTTVILDGAHNPDAARVLARAYRASAWGKKKAAVIFACLKDKDARAIARALAPLAARVFTVPLKTARGRGATELSALWPRRIPAVACASFAEAWARARRQGPVLVTGSLYLVGDSLRFFGKEPT